MCHLPCLTGNTNPVVVMLTPIILATQEAEISKVSLSMIVHKILSQKNPSQKHLVEWLKL
jgi:hypothetical protein